MLTSAPRALVKESKVESVAFNVTNALNAILFHKYFYLLIP